MAAVGTVEGAMEGATEGVTEGVMVATTNEIQTNFLRPFPKFKVLVL